MHIHLPRPLHGWRQFFGEFGIIVLGILTALGLEQVIERIHRRHVAHSARVNLEDEVGRNLDAMARRATVQACIDRRLDEAQAVLLEASDGSPIPHPLWIGRPQVWELDAARWQTAAGAGRIALLPPDEQFGFATLYLRFATMRESEAIEQIAWARLRGLEILPRITPVGANDLVQALQDARYANWRIKAATAEARSLARAHGYAARPLGIEPGSPSTCVPLHTDRAQALAIVSKGRPLWGGEP